MTETKKDEPNDDIFEETWSALTPGDLGLKVGYLEDGGAVTFREIVGWVVFNSRSVKGTGVVRRGFGAIVIADNGFPAAAGNMPGYLGTFHKGMTPPEAW